MMNSHYWNRIIIKKGKSCAPSSTTLTPSCGSSETNELNVYLTAQFLFGMKGQDFQILDLWQKIEAQYPILASMAKQMFSMPVFTIAIEQKFSSSDQTIMD